MDEKKISQSATATGLLQLIAILMMILGVIHILAGIPLLLLLGFGLIPMALGFLCFYYGLQIWHLRTKAYMGTMVITGIGVLLSLGTHNYVSLALSVIILYVIYSNQDKFVN